jgi:hypothetical protein
MPVLESNVDSRSDAFRANTQAMQSLVSELRAKVTEIARGGGEAARERHYALRSRSFYPLSPKGGEGIRIFDCYACA